MTPEQPVEAVVVAAVVVDDGDAYAADDVLVHLHAVLYAGTDGNIMSYHKSFTDFLLDKNRSKEFACDEACFHQLMAERCFCIMTSHLRFNITNITSSHLFDANNLSLKSQVNQHIGPLLSYCCRTWSQHLTMSSPFPTSSSTLTAFLQLPVLFWIEAMNLLGVSTSCDAHLQQASQWVEPVCCTTFIINEFSDTKNTA